MRHEKIHVVQDEQIGPLARSHGPQAALDRRRPGGFRGCAQCREQARVQRLDPVDRSGDVPEENERVVVASVDRHPRDTPCFGRRPLREQRGLAISRRSDHQHRLRRLAPPQPRDQCGSRYDARPNGRRLDLARENREAWLGQRTCAASCPASSPDRVNRHRVFPRARRLVVDREDALVAVGRTHADVGAAEIETGQRA